MARLTPLLAFAVIAGCGGSHWGGPPPAAPPPAATVSAPPALPAAAPRASTHEPHILLGKPGFRDALLKRAAAWTALRAKCEEHANATVEWPDGEDYADKAIAEGYQGEGYFHPLVRLALCAQLDVSGPFAKKGVEVLVHMSEPEGPHAPKMEHDQVYGVRFYGVGMALGYDWLYDAMTADERARVKKAIARWLDAYEKKGFGRDHPQGNYFAGYYAARGLAALATGDGWESWKKEVHDAKVAPYYREKLAGGGWPEGWGYGALATLNMCWPALAKPELVADYKFCVEQAYDVMHFAWPSRKSLDDRGMLHPSDVPAALDMSLLAPLSSALGAANDPLAPAFHRFAKDAARGEPWIELLFWDPAAPDGDLASEPRSYFARGMNAVAMRSSWDANATWASFVAGPYTGNPDSGEQYFDEGSLSIVRGDRPVLAYAPSSLARPKKDGGRFKDKVYEDLFGGDKPRTLFNVFYAGGKGQIAKPDAKTRVTRFEDGGEWVLVRAENIDDAYRDRAVSSWTRQIAYVRPSLFVVDDRTTVPEGTSEQHLAWHVEQSPHDTGRAGRVELGDLGAITTVLPRGARTKIVDVLSSGKVWRVEVRPADGARDQHWLTVIDASSKPSPATAAAIVDGKASGVAVGSTRVIAADAPDAAALAWRGGAGFHLVTGLAPDRGYEMTSKDGVVKIVAKEGGALKSSKGGVLAFTVP